MKQFLYTAVCAASLAMPLAACTPIATAAGIGATVGIAAAQDGGIDGAIQDKSIYLKISDLWLQHDKDMYRRLNLNVREGRVLVAGAVPNAEMRMEAIRLAWQAKGVKQVINEVAVEEGTGVTGFITDSVISGNLKTQMIFDKHVQSINYNIETVNGTVYLMGVAQNPDELQKALTLARNTRGVKNVVSYVRLHGAEELGVLPPDAQPQDWNNMQDYHKAGMSHTGHAPASTPSARQPQAVESEPLPYRG